jgi:glycosyltransferase involved in cell wall biosynthesis
VRSTPVRILLIGPLHPPIGGAGRHFATLAEDLRSNPRFRTTLIDTARGEEYMSVSRNLRAAFKVMCSMISQIRDSDIVSFHANNRGMLLFGPIVVLLGKLAGVPTMLRIFGGSFGDLYQSRGALTKAVIERWILSSGVVLVQTRRMVRQLEVIPAANVEWFSTYVKRNANPRLEAAQKQSQRASICRRFVFLGRLRRSKGIEILLEAAAKLPGECIIDVFGSEDEYTANDIDGRGLGRVRYRGVLTYDEVDAALWDYDCLVLPTCHPSEGYPGVIAEAFTHSLPVITTEWLALPEIVDQRCGILIRPGDLQAFVAAVTLLHEDPDLWARLKEGARIKSADFDHAYWSNRFEEICEQLVADSA